MVLKILLVLLLVVCVHFDASHGQSCGTAGVCSTEYDAACPEDISTSSLGSCMQSQSSCNAPIQPPANASVQCYNTCVVGALVAGRLTPVRCCADPLLIQPISQTVDPNYVIFRLYDPNSPGLDDYRLNTICNYNIQCPSNFNLHYTLVRRNIQPLSSDGECLDFLRYHFTATGQNIDTDVCGSATDTTPSHFVNGFHGSSLNLEFRSNRVVTNAGFFLAITCINPAPFRVTRQAEQGFQQRRDCVTSRLLPGYRVGKKKRSIQPFDMDKVFHIRNERSFRVSWIRVTTGRVLKYEDNTLIVEEKGKVFYLFKNIQVLQVFNRIEGYLTFYSRSNPPGRTFPGYGKLHLGSGIAYFIQTIVDPRFLLSEEEELIVSELLGELFRRQAFNNERFYFTPPTEFGKPAINCTINDLAELNNRSCTAVVRAAADYFLRTDPSLKYCQHRR